MHPVPPFEPTPPDQVWRAGRLAAGHHRPPSGAWLYKRVLAGKSSAAVKGGGNPTGVDGLGFLAPGRGVRSWERPSPVGGTVYAVSRRKRSRCTRPVLGEAGGCPISSGAAFPSVCEGVRERGRVVGELPVGQRVCLSLSLSVGGAASLPRMCVSLIFDVPTGRGDPSGWESHWPGPPCRFQGLLVLCPGPPSESAR